MQKTPTFMKKLGSGTELRIQQELQNYQVALQEDASYSKLAKIAEAIKNLSNKIRKHQQKNKKEKKWKGSSSIISDVATP